MTIIYLTECDALQEQNAFSGHHDWTTALIAARNIADETGVAVYVANDADCYIDVIYPTGTFEPTELNLDSNGFAYSG